MAEIVSWEKKVYCKSERGGGGRGLYHLSKSGRENFSDFKGFVFSLVFLLQLLLLQVLGNKKDEVL